jgi:hypothetical protein
VLAVAAVGGLVAVLAVQRRANADLAAKNAELADEQAKVQERFELLRKRSRCSTPASARSCCSRTLS